MDLLKETISRIEPASEEKRAGAKARLDALTMPHWALGRLMDLAMDLAGMTHSTRPPVELKTVVIMAGDHGVAAEGVSLYPPEVTLQMIFNFVAGGAGINALARVAGAEVRVVDMGVKGALEALADEKRVRIEHIADGTDSITKGPAMSRDDAVRCVEAGIRTAAELADSTDLFATGDMGIGNTTPSSAIVSVMTGAPAADVTGRGTGIDENKLKEKIAAVETAVEVNRPDPADALDVLAKVGGFEIGGIAGLILGAASMRKPVIVDGFISTAAALIARGIAPLSAQYMIASHNSVEIGHKTALEKLGREPYIDLGLRLGEGTGAALVMNIVEAAARVLTEVATFEEAGVSSAD